MEVVRSVFRKPLLFGWTLMSLLMIGSVSAQDMGQPKFVDVDGIRTRYFERGTGKPLVLIHGGSYGTDPTAEEYSSIWGGLAQHFRVIAFDKLAMGETDPPKNEADYTMDATIRHAYGFLRAMGLPHAILGGHSRGSLPAVRIAIDHPEVVKALVLFDSNTLAPNDSATDIRYIERQDAANPPQLTPKLQKVHDIMLKLQAQYIAEHREEVLQDPQLGVLRSPSPWWIRSTKEETEKLVREGHLKAPTIIIWGYNDPGAPVNLAFRLMDLVFPVVSQAELHIFNQADHWPYAAHPQETIRLIVDFVNRIGDSQMSGNR